MTKKVVMSVSKVGQLKKILYQRLKYPKGYQEVIMIMGCQRSGTTLLSHAYHHLPFCRVFGEFSALTNMPNDRIRLRPFPEVNRILTNCHSPLVVSKPLVESQNANKLLDNIENSRIVWMYRHYLDVALSDVNKFRSIGGKGNLLPIINDEDRNWRNEKLSSEIRYTVNSLFSDCLSPVDYGCLFWWTRNSLYFSQQLETSTKVTLVRYEDFVSQPGKFIANSTCNIVHTIRESDFDSLVYVSSIEKGKGQSISPVIKQLCEDLISRLALYNWCPASNN